MIYELALKLKVIGLNQDRRTGSRYYITPELVMSVENLGGITLADGSQADWTPFVFIPQIEHLLSFLGLDFGEVRQMIHAENGETYCAYDRDGHARAFGSSVLDALANLAIAIAEYEKTPTPPVQGE